MNIGTVIANLDQTIAGKKLYLAQCVKTLEYYGAGECESAKIQFSAVIDMLKISIAELERIREDVKQCANSGGFCGRT